MKLLSIVVLTGILLVTRSLHAADPVIFEFLASNTGSLPDEDGDSSDWIEIYNAGPGAVNLAGWRLTDDPDSLAKWVFPATNLASGQFLVVFASGKNRAVPGARLHTNFELDSAGEYLALVRPDGTVAHQFAPKFPPQVDGISYGTALNVVTTRLVTNGAPGRWTVPLSAADQPEDWASTNFVDVLWNSGRTGLGFDAGSSNVVIGGTATNVAQGKPATQSSTLSSFTPNLAVNGSTTDFTHTAAGQNLPATWEVNLGTNYGLERIVLFNRGDGCCGSRLRDITVRILSADGSATNYTSALLNPENTLGGGGINGPASLSLNLTQLTGGLVIGGRVRITRTPDPDLSGTGGQGNADEANVLSLGEVQVFGLPTSGSFHSLIRTDLATSMRNFNSTALLRVPFLVVAEELPVFDQFTLRMNFDDGFAAFLNGVKVAEANAPASLDWNSAATAEHPDALAFQAESFDLSAHAGLLQDGINVLAIQALNLTAGDDDFLVLPELTGVSVDGSAERYFTQPTPGEVNAEGTLGLVADTKFSVDRGFFDVPFTVAITSATAGVEIRYTTNGSAPSATSGALYTGPIQISRTTVLRAIATKPGWTPSNVDTHTYVFLDQVVAQSHTSVTNAGYPNTWASVAADYAMDPRITVSNATQMIPSLRSLPSMFISTSISNLFHSTAGIYSQPLSHGIAWERPASIEMVDTNGATEFHENAGLRIQGGYFRDPNVTQKHSLRVLFKGIYGAGKLRHDLFKREDAVTEFDGFVLRAGANDGYAWGAAKDTEQFTRDQFGRELHQDMGHPSPHGRFVHLYLNGVYWGLYNLVERPNEDFSASYFGGDPEDWDANNAGDVKSGDLTAWNSFTSQAATATTAAAYERLQGNNPDGSRNPAFPVLLDRLNYIDYMIANIWGGNWDWPNKNFWFGRLRTTNSTGFKHYMWDFENTMGNDRARSPVNMVSPRSGIESSWVGSPHWSLRNNPEYRIDFADRVQRYFFSSGLLTPEILTNRYRALAGHVELSILAETARWGDDNLTPPQDIDDWRREREWILGTYLPQRSAVVLQQFRTSGLYPNVAAPVFSQPGGTVPDGYPLELSHTNASGAIYFTTDGSDPRRRGGAVNPAAQSYSTAIIINAPLFVRARVLIGTNWSALVEGILHPPQDLRRLLVTEIMYNPPAAGLVNGDDYEFLEFKNTGTNTLNLSGLRFTTGITFTFTNGSTLAPGQFFVLVRNPAHFAAKYPGVPIGGVYSGRLDNGGETLRLAQFLGGTVLSATYDDRAPWPVTPDGAGFSLVPADPNANPAPDDARNWRSSSAAAGSPGADDPASLVPAILINEALTASVLLERDAIELFNPTVGEVNLAGWFLTDEPDTPKKFRVPDGTVIGAGGFALFDEAQFNPTPGVSNSFSLRAEGDDLYLFSADAAGNLTGYSHGFSFGAAERGVTFGRYRLSMGEDDFTAQVANSLGGANAGPKIGPVVISEIHYHPDAGDDEFIELRNVTGEPVPLFDPTVPTNTWRLNGLGFDFPQGVTLGANALLLIVPTDPAAFRAKYGVGPEVTILGPYAGQLQDSGERLELQKPGPLDTNGAIAHINVDAVRYNDRAPWPPAADGSGPSLQRINSLAYGNDPVNWEGAAATPGREFIVGTRPGILTPPADAVGVATFSVTFRVVAGGPGPFSYQWRRNGANLDVPSANSAELTLLNLHPSQAGDYSVLVFNPFGSVESASAQLTIVLPPTISQHPVGRAVYIKPDPRAANLVNGTNVTFNIAAMSGNSAVSYQWRFNGVDIPGATSSSLTISNVQLENEGDYTCAVTDTIATVVSRPARLVPWLQPIIVQPPVNQAVVAGGDFTLSAQVTGNPLPMAYSWRRGSIIIASNYGNFRSNFVTLNTTVAGLVLTSNMLSSNYTMRLVVYNDANNSPGVLTVFTNTVLADLDRDGIPDVIENELGLSANNAADAAQDLDGDGLSNGAEYVAGTDPTNRLSYLRIDQGPGAATVRVAAVSNRTYSVQYTDRLDSGQWTRLADIIARPTNRVETFTDPSGTTNRYYRVALPRQP
jgi:hypothetical protein